MSFPALSMLAEMFVPRVERANAKDVKNAAARLSHLSISLSGSQRTSPWSVRPALDGDANEAVYAKSCGRRAQVHY